MRIEKPIKWHSPAISVLFKTKTYPSTIAGIPAGITPLGFCTPWTVGVGSIVGVLVGGAIVCVLVGGAIVKVEMFVCVTVGGTRIGESVSPNFSGELFVEFVRPNTIVRSPV